MIKKSSAKENFGGKNRCRFPTLAKYTFDKGEVEQMLKEEKEKIDFLEKTSKNIFRYVTGLHALNHITTPTPKFQDKN